MGRTANSLRARQKRRLKLTAAMILLLFSALLCRLYYLQILCHTSLEEAAVSQYEVAVEGLDTRGMIFDRNLMPMTGGTSQYTYILENSRMDAGAQKLLSSVSARKISVSLRREGRYAAYRTQIFDRTVNRRLQEDYHAYILCTAARYSDSQIACHLVGYLNEAEKKGVSGLEKACETTLAAQEKTMVLWADSSGGLLTGIAPKTEGSSESGLREEDGNVVTTLDSGLQRACETALSRRNASGAVLVSDVESGQILAWASSPVFNPNTVADYLEEEGDCLVDKCIQGMYAPGSVFKIVVAAAALESGIIDPQQRYECSGEEVTGGIPIHCSLGPEGGHGAVNLEEAVAVSCNCYFAALGERLGSGRILDMAERLGLGSLVFSRFTEELPGSIPDAESLGQWDISNLSVGQGTLQVTPAQIHRMISIVAGGGRQSRLTVIMPDGGENGYSGTYDAKQILPADTAAALEEMLSAVMTEGTGRNSRRTVQAWGKTGTAETVRDGEETCDCWFSGWCDAGGGRLAVTVLIEDGISGSASALPVYDEIAEYVQARQLEVE